MFYVVNATGSEVYLILYEVLAVALQVSGHFEICTHLLKFREDDGTTEMVVISKLRECLVKAP